MGEFSASSPSSSQELAEAESFVVLPPDGLRCRRTDGKGWYCKGWRIHNQRYCERHYLKFLPKRSNFRDMSVSSGSRCSSRLATKTGRRIGGSGGLSREERRKSNGRNGKKRGRRGVKDRQSDEEVIPEKKQRSQATMDKGDDEGDKSEDERANSLRKGAKRKVRGFRGKKLVAMAKVKLDEQIEESDEDDRDDSEKDSTFEENNLVMVTKTEHGEEEEEPGDEKVLTSQRGAKKNVKVVSLARNVKSVGRKSGATGKGKRREEEEEEDNNSEDGSENEDVKIKSSSLKRKNEVVKVVEKKEHEENDSDDEKEKFRLVKRHNNVRNESKWIKKKKVQKVGAEKLGLVTKMEKEEENHVENDSENNNSLGTRKRILKQQSLKNDARRRYNNGGEDECQMCHQCQLSTLRVVRCRRSCRRRFCVACIRRWLMFFSLFEILFGDLKREII